MMDKAKRRMMMIIIVLVVATGLKNEKTKDEKQRKVNSGQGRSKSWEEGAVFF